MSENQEEKDGIAAIQYLQKMAGIDESDDQARAGWNALTKHQQEFTKKIYTDIVNGPAALVSNN